MRQSCYQNSHQARQMPSLKSLLEGHCFQEASYSSLLTSCCSALQALGVLPGVVPVPTHVLRACPFTASDEVSSGTQTLMHLWFS